MPRPATLEPAQLLRTLSAEPQRPAQLAATHGVSRATVQRKLAHLLEQGLVVRVGEGPTAAYRLPTVQEQLDKARLPQTQLRLEVAPRTADRIQRALDLYTRMGLGQLEELANLARWQEFKHADGSALTYPELEEVERRVFSLKHSLLGWNPNASYGIFSPQVAEDIRTVWAMNRALRHRLAWDRKPEGGMGVWHDEPMRAEKAAGFVVHSSEPDARGEPTRYFLEMPREHVPLLAAALRFYIRASVGELQDLVALARAGVLRHADGRPVDEQALKQGERICAELGTLIAGADAQRNVALTNTAADLLQVVKALEEHQAKDGRFVESVQPDGTAVRVSSVGSSAFAVNVADLPEGMMMNFSKGSYRIIAQADDGVHLAIVAESHSPQTAVMMARNRAAGRRARDFSL